MASFLLSDCGRQRIHYASIPTCQELKLHPKGSFFCLSETPQPFHHLKWKVRFFFL